MLGALDDDVDGGSEHSEHRLNLFLAMQLERFENGSVSIGERDPMHGVGVEFRQGPLFVLRALGKEPVGRQRECS